MKAFATYCVACNPAPNGLEVSRPPTLAVLPSLYVSLAGKTSVHFAQLGGSAPSSCQACPDYDRSRGGCPHRSDLGGDL